MARKMTSGKAAAKRNGKPKFTRRADPAGMYIAQSFAQSMRDDFGVENIHAIKVAVTPGQVDQYELPRGPKVKIKRKGKKDDPRAAKFIELHGEHVYEVESLPDGEPEKLLDEAIRSVLNLDAYNHECEQEPVDVDDITSKRKSALWALQGMIDDPPTDEDDE